MKNEIKFLGLGGKELEKLSRDMLLSLNLKEMKEIQDYYKSKGREPAQIELETLAQTWSEHCKHKVFNALIDYVEDGKGEKIDSLFKSYIVKATDEAGKKKKDFLVSVFSDNAGIVKFNDEFNVAFKVETHNHPSALDPYGGANTGIGGVIRDVLGCGLGAKPIANTDIFCFGEFDMPAKDVPAGILHPKRIAKGVRLGVRDYGNRMGIPTVNGAILFEERYLGNPLVFCGTVGIIPKGMETKAAKDGDFIISVGGKTGRDGIHGATFSSIELDESTSSAAVQIGNAIEEKKVLDVILQARDKGLYNAITDCGAGGFSSAVGEMGEDLGAEVHLEKAPLKYEGLEPWEIWVSEAQERMVVAVSPEHEKEFIELCANEDVEATVIGKFVKTGMLKLLYNGEIAGDLEMEFLHNGGPRRELKAKWENKGEKKITIKNSGNLGDDLHKLLSHPNIASKETTIRQYDHEVQGGSIIKPLVGAENDGPSDAAIVRPLLDKNEGIAIANGINPMYGDIDPYWMAASAIDEAVRNIISVGGNLEGIALLDNFCWGNPEKEDKLGELVRTVKGCYDAATAYDLPFISGKDSFYNEFILKGKTIAIPGTLLISAIGVMKDSRKRISMDLKEEGNLIYVVGKTFNEMGSSHYALLNGIKEGAVPKVRFKEARKNFESLVKVIAVGEKNDERIVRACHDCSEGGLGVAISEMAFAGMKSVEIDLGKVLKGEEIDSDAVLLFSESNSRLVVEVNAKKKEEFEELMKEREISEIGIVKSGNELVIKGLDGKEIVKENLNELKESWKKTLRW
ncbi:MAG: phosphoribosylformylglycinamidine synthase subunit PurL [Candidatus Diapherotrites archaeon]